MTAGDYIQFFLFLAGLRDKLKFDSCLGIGGNVLKLAEIIDRAEHGQEFDDLTVMALVLTNIGNAIAAQQSQDAGIPLRDLDIRVSAYRTENGAEVDFIVERGS